MSDNDEVLEQTVVEPVAVAEETTPPADDTVKSEDEKDQPEAKPEKTFTQKELDDILTRRLAKEQRKIERYAKAEAERDYLREQLSQRQQPQQSDNPSGEPKPEQFKTYEDYIDKLTDWKLEQKLAKMQEKTAQDREAKAQAEYEVKAGDNLRKGIDKFDDYEDVVESIPAEYITNAMVQAIAESDKADEISYYLGNNHKEAAAIAKMSPVQQVKAIDRLEAKLGTPPKVSEAPPPANVVGKGKASQQASLESVSLDDYMKIRQKQGARWANR